MRFLVSSGQPMGEPVSSWGSIAINTEEELKIAFGEYERGTFLKHEKR